MKIKLIISIVLFYLVTSFLSTGESLAQESQRREGAYLVVEGNVSTVTARSLVIDGQQYPISMFARAFMGSGKGHEVPLQMIANTGKIDRARIYILGGKVEKIIVLKNI